MFFTVYSTYIANNNNIKYTVEKSARPLLIGKRTEQLNYVKCLFNIVGVLLVQFCGCYMSKSSDNDSMNEFPFINFVVPMTNSTFAAEKKIYCYT